MFGSSTSPSPACHLLTDFRSCLFSIPWISTRRSQVPPHGVGKHLSDVTSIAEKIKGSARLMKSGKTPVSLGKSSTSGRPHLVMSVSRRLPSQENVVFFARLGLNGFLKSRQVRQKLVAGSAWGCLSQPVW